MTIDDMRMVHRPAAIRRRDGVDWVRLADWELLEAERDKFYQLWVEATIDSRKRYAGGVRPIGRYRGDLRGLRRHVEETWAEGLRKKGATHD